MAQLHRRVSRLPYRPLTIAIVLWLPSIVAAQDEIASDGDPRLEQLERYVTELASEDEAERRAAYDAMITLGPEMLPAIRARIEYVRRRRPEQRYAFDIWNQIRRGAGSERADDEVDIAPGVLVALRASRRERVLRMVEPLLYLRALERVGTFEACRAMYFLFVLDDGLWRFEQRRVVNRMGPRMMAAAIAARNHDDRHVRAWATATMRRLGADDPGRAVQGLDHEVLADVIRAYAMLRMQSAMRVIVSYTDSDRRSVRHAARWAMEQYGGNAIWILRTEYHNITGEHPPQSWGWRRVSEELYGRVDAARMEPVRRAYDEGIAARDRGDLEAMEQRFAEVLARTPDIEDGDAMAEGYALLATQQPRRAAWAYRRALRLAPEHTNAAQWRAQLLFLDAERDRRAGFADPDAYRGVLALHAEHEASREVLETLEEPDPVAIRAQTVWAWLAAAILALLGAVLLWTIRRGPRRVAAAYESTIEAPTFEEADATLQDVTAPG
jgi:hypothetical protein